MTMNENTSNLQVVLGASGGVGGAVVRELVRQGLPVRGVTHSGTGDMPQGVEMVAANISHLDQACAACAGASTIFFCGNPKYTDWRRDFPPMLEGAIAGAKASNARLIVTDNLYVYAPTSQPMTEDLPWQPVTRKGKVRAAMDERLLAAHRSGELRMAIGRASDFFGPGALNSAICGEYFFKALFAGKPVDWIGRLDMPHTMSYIKDFGRGLVTLSQHESALGQAWHIPAAAPITGQQLLDMVFEAAGQRAKVRRTTKSMLQLIGIFNPMLREVAEMSFEFEAPFIMDSTKFTRAFGGSPTHLPEAVDATVAWFKEHYALLN